MRTLWGRAKWIAARVKAAWETDRAFGEALALYRLSFCEHRHAERRPRHVDTPLDIVWFCRDCKQQMEAR